MEVPWARLEEKIDGIGTRLGVVEDRLQVVDNRLQVVDNRLQGVDERLDGLGGQVTSLSCQVTSLAAAVHTQGVLLEAAHNDIKLVAERTLSLREAMDREFAEVISRLDQRVQPVEAASRYLAAQLPTAKRRGK